MGRKPNPRERGRLARASRDSAAILDSTAEDDGDSRIPGRTGPWVHERRLCLRQAHLPRCGRESGQDGTAGPGPQRHSTPGETPGAIVAGWTGGGPCFERMSA